MGIKLPKIKVGKFLKKVATSVPKVVGKVAKAAPVIGTVVQTADDVIGAFKKRTSSGQSVMGAAANTAADYSPDAQAQKTLLLVAGAVILLLVMMRK